MFFLWAFASFRAARNHGRLLSGVTTGLLVAFATFCVYDLLVQLRVNLFLDDLTGRADWQSMMRRFRASEFDSLRLFINLEYLKGAPLKIAVASAIGALMGIIGGSMGWLASRRTAATAKTAVHSSLRFDECERLPLVEFVQVLRGHVQILRGRLQLRVTEPCGDRVQRPRLLPAVAFELPAAGFMPKIMEVQIDLGEFRSVLG
jgi:hypothetical protein